MQWCGLVNDVSVSIKAENESDRSFNELGLINNEN